jgi:hypothetical protein
MNRCRTFFWSGHHCSAEGDLDDIQPGTISMPINDDQGKKVKSEKTGE